MTFILQRLAALLRPDPVAAAAREAAERVAARKMASGKSRRSRCVADPEIRAFLVERFGTLTVDQAVAEARRRFGVRAPSRSAIGRFFKSIGDQVAKDQS